MATPNMPFFFSIIRYGFGGCKSGFGKGRMSCMTAAASRNGAAKRMRLGVSPQASAPAESPAAAKARNYKKVGSEIFRWFL